MRTSIYYGSQADEIAHFEDKGFAAERLELCTILRGPRATRANGTVYFEAVAFGGKRAKPDWHYTFSTVERREVYIARYLEGQRAHAERMAAYKATRTISNHAAAAKMIRAELAANFPGVAFRVHSEGYSMGDSINVYWTDGPTAESVEAITAKYQMGNFDGMTDCYEYSNRRNDIPQSKYIFTNREMSEAAKSELSRRLGEYWGVDMGNEKAVESRTCLEPYELIYREFRKTSF